MEKLNVGKILPNLTVSVPVDSNVSESPDTVNKDQFNETSVTEIVRPSLEQFRTKKLYNDGGFTTGIDLIALEDSGILNKRAERFNLEIDETKPSISAFYESLGIDVKNRNSAEMKKIRLNAIHIRGVEELTEDEVMHYFREFGPSEVEWINDASCNIIFPDEASSTRALFNLTKNLPDSFPLIDITDSPKKNAAVDISSLKLDDKQENEAMDTDDAPQSNEISIPVPPGNWRLGLPHPKAKTLLLRFAKKDDKKVPGAEKRSKFYQIHGNPRYGGLKGLISSSKKHRVQAEANRLAVKEESSSSYKSFPNNQFATSVSKVKPKSFRMRMYADDEELKTKTFRTKRNETESRGSVHSRLGQKYTTEDLYQLGPHKDSVNDFKDTHNRYSYSHKYKDLDRPEVGNSANDMLELYNPREYKNYERPRVYKTVDSRRSSRDFHKDSKSHDLDRSRNSWDLRSKLKRNRDRKPYEGKYSESYKERNEKLQVFSRIDYLKKESKTFFKRKHRSPLCEDDEEEEEDDKSSVD